jgi:hypothetical protein
MATKSFGSREVRTMAAWPPELRESQVVRMKRRIVVGVAAATLALSACSGTVLELDVGTCFDDPEDFEEVEEVPIVDCAETWAIGDREVICFAYDIELEKITGSINGAGQ